MGESEFLPFSLNEERLNELKEEFECKKNAFADINSELKQLEDELEYIRLRYEAGPGLLYDRLDEIGFELSRCRKIRTLIKRGVPYEQACREWEESHPDKKSADPQNVEIKDDTLPLDEEITPALKALWRELVSRFHPDLSACPDEKQRRTEIMKSLNSAYTKQDIEWLESFSASCAEPVHSETDIDDLTDRIDRLDKACLAAKRRIKDLRGIVWFEWKQEIADAKARGSNLMEDLERTLTLRLNDKIRQLDKIKRDLPDESRA